MPRRIDWVTTEAEWAKEVAWLEEHGDVHSREYREAAANLRTARRHVELAEEKQAAQARWDAMPVKDAAKTIADRLTEY